MRGPHGELPVRIKGDVQSGFNAEFTPTTVGAHTINVEYNGYAVQVSKFDLVTPNQIPNIGTHTRKQTHCTAKHSET